MSPFPMHDRTDTIVAVSTPPGRGGVGCVRLSGERAIEIAESLFRTAGDAAGTNLRPDLDELLLDLELLRAQRRDLLLLLLLPGPETAVFCD